MCGVDAEDIADMVDEIKALNPKPALAFDHVVAEAVTPDVTVRRKTGGGWVVEVNNEALPQVLVNNRYFTEISKQATRQEDKEYIAECYQTANWLVRALHQRAQTILKVTTEIVRHQEEFLNKGVQYLKPLVLRDIGKALDIHESTVSRVTTNKYVDDAPGNFRAQILLHLCGRRIAGWKRCPVGGGYPLPDQIPDRWGIAGKRTFRRQDSLDPFATMVSMLRGGRSPSIGNPCIFPRPCNGAGKKRC